MKKKILAGLIFTAVIVCCVVAVVLSREETGSNGPDEFEAIGQEAFETAGQEEFEAVGKGIRKQVAALMESEEKATASYMGEVQGEKISKEYFEVRYHSYKTHPLNYSDPKTEAWNSIKLEFWEKHFAAQNGLTPTDEEIEEYVEYNKKGFEAEEEGRTLITAYAGGMGMSVKEYWQYNKEYVAPVAVTHRKVAEYLAAAGLEQPAYHEIEAQVTDQEYFDQLD